MFQYISHIPFFDSPSGDFPIGKIKYISSPANRSIYINSCVCDWNESASPKHSLGISWNLVVNKNDDDASFAPDTRSATILGEFPGHDGFPEGNCWVYGRIFGGVLGGELPTSLVFVG